MPLIASACGVNRLDLRNRLLCALVVSGILQGAMLFRACDCMAALADGAGKTSQQSDSDSDSLSIKVQDAILKTIESTDVATEVAGTIKQLKIAEGDTVKVGQSLGLIGSKAVLLKVENAKTQLAISRKKASSDIDLRLAQRRLEVAQNELERAENANVRLPNTYAIKEIDRLRLVAATAELEVERANYAQELHKLEAALDENLYQQARESLAKHEIKSPASGVIVKLNKLVGEWVEPGTELLRIVKIDRLRIEGFVKAEHLPQVVDGRTALVTVQKGDREYEIKGRVVFTSLEVNPVNGLVRVFLEIDNSDSRFYPGLRVEAEIK